MCWKKGGCIILKSSFEHHREDYKSHSVIKSATKIDEAAVVVFEDGKVIEFQDCWLRDHCRCRTCYHADTYQRAQHILKIPHAKIYQLSFTSSHLKVIWDDKHESSYGAEFLALFDYTKWNESRRLKPLLWRGNEIVDKVTRIHVNDFLNSPEGHKKVFGSLIKYGVVFIEGVEASLEATEVVCEALGGVQHTIFGGMWQFTTRADHADTAYTNLPLAVHNDNTYFTEAAGLQILHCLEHSGGVGGETILVDGYYGATRLREERPEDYRFLTTFNLEAEYIENGHHHKHSAPVIQIDGSTNDIKQIRFNVYDRSPMAFSSGEECRNYYRSLKNLATYYEDVENQWQFKLTPGVVMAVDNFRVLHGRTGFSGTRVLGGSYVSRSDWLDKARVYGYIQ